MGAFRSQRSRGVTHTTHAPVTLAFQANVAHMVHIVAAQSVANGLLFLLKR